MTLEEIEAIRTRAYDCLKPIEDGCDYGTMAIVLNKAFNLVDIALEEAIKELKLHRAYQNSIAKAAGL